MKTKTYLLRVIRALFVLIFAVLFIFPYGLPTNAAPVTTLKDIMSTITDSAAANHTISWVSPSGVANASTIVITFPAGFSLTGVDEGDVDIAGSTEGELTVAADCSAADDASAVVALQVLTITLCTGDGGDFTNSETITVEIGTHAAGGAQQIDNQTAAQNNTDSKIIVASGASDSGTLAVEIIADDSVSVSATVDPSITFSISDLIIGFGVLDSTQECWALGSPPALCDSTQTAAHTVSIGTNATNGYSITYSGATLTNPSTSDTITVADINGDADGSPTTEQFALGASTAGDATITTDYAQASSNFRFIATGSNEFVSELGPTATEAISLYYIANISASTEAGAYSTSITYIATAAF